LAAPQPAPDPADNVTVNIVGVSVLKGTAREVLNDALQSFGTDVLGEASYTERGRNRRYTDVIDYSAGDVGLAEQVVRNRGLPPEPRGTWYYVRRVTQWLTTLFAGICGGLLPTGWGWWIPLAVSGTAALLLTMDLERSDYEEHNDGKRKRAR